MNTQSYTAQLIKSRANDTTYLVRGRLGEKLLWHYLQVDKLKVPLFLKMVKGEHFDITEYGIVLSSGWGDNPPPFTN